MQYKLDSGWKCKMNQTIKTKEDIIKESIVSACGCDTDHHNGVYISTEYKNKIIYFCA